MNAAEAVQTVTVKNPQLSPVVPATVIISKSLPVPPKNQRRGVLAPVWAKMEIGDSFFVRVISRATGDFTHVQQQLSAMARQYGRRTGTKFVTRRSDDGVRIWRTI